MYYFGIIFNKCEKKIAIIISSPIYIRNYLLTNAFSEIERNNEIILLITEELNFISKDSRFKKYKIVNYKYSKFLKKCARLINELSLFKNHNLSKDFSYRIKRKYNHTPHLNDGTLNARKIDKRLKIFIVKNLLRLISRKKILNLIGNLGTKIFSIKSPIQEFLGQQKIDFLICPCSAAGTEEFDIGAYTSSVTNKTKTILIIDNWDNLSSKYVMFHQPNHTIVWGEQTRIHGIIYQGIKPDKITALGTPRFYCYSNQFKIKKDENNVLPKLPKKYILFIGSQTFFNEELVLKELKNLIKEKFNQFELIYRPHPWREINKKVKKVSGIILDPTLTIESESYGSVLLPKLELYNHIISNASLIIGGCTSMIVESSLMRKPYLLLAHDDGNPIQTPFENYINREHQNLTAALNNVSICFSLDSLYEQMHYLFEKKIKEKDSVLENIISSKYSNFDHYLNQLIEKM